MGYVERPTGTLVRVCWLDRQNAKQEAEFPEAALHLVADDEFDVVSVGFPPGLYRPGRATRPARDCPVCGSPLDGHLFSCRRHAGLAPGDLPFELAHHLDQSLLRNAGRHDRLHA